MFIMLSLILLLVYIICSGEAKVGCPQIVDRPISLQETIRGFWATLNPRKYDISEMKYFVMTPRSFPNFINPTGDMIDWTMLGCDRKQVLFNCHGWFGNALDPRYLEIIRTFVRQHGGCAVSCDYSGAAYNINVLATFSETSNISGAIANYVQRFICRVIDCTQLLQLHGHSWGAHTCGVAGFLLSQRGLKPARMIASDAAAPYFSNSPSQDPALYLSPKSAKVVIDIKTSKLLGQDLYNPKWAHQTQYIGLCGSAQDQCPGKGIMESDGCDHSASVYIVKSTIDLNFPLIKLMNCTSCPYVTPNSLPLPGECSDVKENLGWRSNGLPGKFYIRTLPECLNVDLGSQYSTNRG